MTFLSGLKRQDTGPTAGEIRTVLSAIQRERSSLESLVTRAEAAAGELQAAQSGDSAAMAALLGERVATLEQQLRAIDALSPTLERAMMRLTAFDESWTSAEAKIAAIEERTSTATGIVGAMKEQSERRLRSPEVRRSLILARAHIAAGFGRRQQAVDLLRMATARTAFPLGAAHAFHHDLLLASLRGYAPFDAMLTAGN